MCSPERGIDNTIKSRLERQNNPLPMDQDQDRATYQRLMKDYHELEQKLATCSPGHARSLSNASSGSSADKTIQDDQNTLQQKFKDLEKENGRLMRMVEDFGRECPETNGTTRTHNSCRMQELKLQNAQLKKDLGSLRKSVLRGVCSTGIFGIFTRVLHTFLHLVLSIFFPRRKKNLQSESAGVNLERKQYLSKEKQLEDELQAKERQWKAQKDKWMAEIERLQEEIQRQQKILSVKLSKSSETQTEAYMQSEITKLTSENLDLQEKYDKAADSCRSLEKQIKILQRRLRDTEHELQVKERQWDAQKDETLAEIERLQDEVERQQKILSVKLSKLLETQTEAYMKPEITKLTSENLNLQGKYDKAAESFKSLKKQIKILRLRDGEVPKNAKVNGDGVSMPIKTTNTSSVDDSGSSMMPATIPRKERDFEGMFKFRKEDIDIIMRNLITDLKPRVAIALLPGLPAYILFMCIRHTDCNNDHNKVRAFLTRFLNTLKRVIKRSNNFESTVLWLSNTLRLLHNMKQYSGEKPFQIENTPRQNEQCLRNFDLSEYHVVLSSVALWIFNKIINQLKEILQPLVVPAILENEAIAGLISRPANRPRSSPIGQQQMGNNADIRRDRLNILLEHLAIVHKTLQYHGVDLEIIVQLFKQLFYFMCASALNNLLLRSELCHWSKGMQIRFNLSHLERWATDVMLITAVDSFQPIIQAAQLLQARKEDQDVDSVCEMCNKLTANQIIKILNLYTPADEFETHVPISFIRKVQTKLDERGDKNEQLFMDLKHLFPVRFSFNPSNIRMEDIEIPEVLNLPMLKKI